LAKEQADAQELKNAEARGELVSADQIEGAMIWLTTSLSARLQSLGVRIAQELAAEGTAAGCQGIVDEQVNAALNELADGADRAAAGWSRP